MGRKCPGHIFIPPDPNPATLRPLSLGWGCGETAYSSTSEKHWEQRDRLPTFQGLRSKVALWRSVSPTEEGGLCSLCNLALQNLRDPCSGVGHLCIGSESLMTLQFCQQSEGSSRHGIWVCCAQGHLVYGPWGVFIDE